jgi:hypothetical protein
LPAKRSGRYRAESTSEYATQETRKFLEGLRQQTEHDGGYIAIIEVCGFIEDYELVNQQLKIGRCVDADLLSPHQKTAGREDCPRGCDATVVYGDLSHAPEERTLRGRRPGFLLDTNAPVVAHQGRQMAANALAHCSLSACRSPGGRGQYFQRVARPIARKCARSSRRGRCSLVFRSTARQRPILHEKDGL